LLRYLPQTCLQSTPDTFCDACNRAYSGPSMRDKAPQGTKPLSGVTSATNPINIATVSGGQKPGLQMTFGGYTVVPDPDWPAMYRVRSPDGSLTDMVNLTRARDAARCFAE
jgi:hypothetical protein